MDPSGADRLKDAATRGRLGVASAVAGVVLGMALAGAWVERQPIVVHFAARELAARHVSARYRIVAIGPFAQRLEDVSIGDPAAPDLTARAIELQLAYGLSGPRLAAVRADGVRLNARVIDGRVSLGAIDRLLPKTAGHAPLALPDLAVTLADTRVTLATPAGIVAATVAGDGNLANGFQGRVTATSLLLRAAGCAVARPTAALDVHIVGREPTLTGPIDIGGLACGSRVMTGAGRAAVDLVFARSLDRWRGGVTLSDFAGAGGGVRFGALAGRVGLSGERRAFAGGVRLAASGLAAAPGKAARATLDGQYRYRAGAGLVFAGDVAVDQAALAEDRRRRLRDSALALASTPIGPLAARAAAAAEALLSDATVHATVALSLGGPNGNFARARTVDVTGGGEEHIRLAGGDGVGWTARGWRVDSRLTTGGGDLPVLDVLLAQVAPGAAVAGVARLRPYVAGTARLALTPARFLLAADGTTRFDTVALLDGPVGGGRITGLSVPISGHLDPRGGFGLGEGCVVIGVRALALSGVVLDPATLRACGIGGAPIVAVRDGAVSAGLSIADAHVTGRSGGAPLAVAVKAVRLDSAGLAVDRLAAALGQPEAQTTLAVASLAGSAAGGGFAGTFTDASGAIAHVPLALSGAVGTWRVAGGALTLTGALTVADAAAAPRFLPLAALDVTLDLRDGKIDAGGTLHEPKSGALVSDVTIRHDLGTGVGGAVLEVPQLEFVPKGLQPEALTPLTLGVIANVSGTVFGTGHIAWTGQGVTSGGEFTTKGVDLAAAFGPVSKIVGTIRFADLLGLVTPPHQEARIAEVNPGIAVDAGVVHYQLVGADRVQVEDARWPFAGGTLALEPSLLSFGLASQRHLTFRVDGLDAAAFVQQLDFPNVAATGVFDGTLPMIFDDTGGRIERGLLTARPAGGTLAYVGELTNAQLGTMGKLAFDALKAVRYNSLSIALDGKLDGEIVSNVRFEGVRQATGDAGMVARMIYNLPFRFNIAIRAPFRGLVGSARAYADPNLLLDRALLTTIAPSGAARARLGATTSAPPRAIQPAESETVR